MPAKIITLTTDFGYGDWFAGTMKGVILSIAPEACVLDLNHGIEKFNVRDAAFSIAASYDYFPEGTVHVAVIDPGVGGARRALYAKTRKYFFVVPDNGVLTPVLQKEKNVEMYHADNADYFLSEISSTFHGRDIFAPLAAHLANGVEPDRMGHRIDDPVLLDSYRLSSTSSGIIEGEIVWIDTFGNLITNIPHTMLNSACELEIPDALVRLKGINKTYDAVPAGAPVLICGSSGYLEIAVNQGNASRRFGLKKGTKISILNQ